ncbi:polysaccharide pyruvyl transferase family protein [Sharpea azabuensis]|uniref:polysaccharide pyruvyl transferase family protein n=1 Tax=Sharpea azabuensis TaxID=322505 RepID=UPI00156775CD|nr:polysaccharide pyruvyl transferase family protein [Sharpea azabuensis]
MKTILYGNGGCGNHGCEAIVRGTYELFKKPLIISSENIYEDIRYGLEEFCDIYDAKAGSPGKLEFVKAYMKLKIMGDYTAMDGLPYLSTIRELSDKSTLALSVGGDNYCYTNQKLYAFLNKAYQDNGVKTVLWGCSIEPEIVKDADVSRDLKSYKLIVARESITYKAVKEIDANVVLAPDPAFFMQAKECELDQRFNNGNVIGINISPMILSNEKQSGAVYANYKNLVEFILRNTNMNIALIPHVVWQQNDDRRVLKKLYDDFRHDQRLIMVEDHKAPELKYIISKCRMFVGARTHSTIAAYSTMVPTLVVGYSVKARGIATDLFGTDEKYVLPVQNLKNEGELTEAFCWMSDNEDKIRNHLKRFIPNYLNDGKHIRSILESV